MSRARRGSAVKNAFHLGFGQIVTTILTILLSAALARMLGPSDFGQLYILMSTAAFAYVLIDWGHGSIITRETARHPDRSGDLFGSAMAARVVSALVACPVAVAILWLLGYDLSTRLLAGALILAWLPQYLALSFGWVFRGYGRMDRDALLAVILKLVTLIVSIACLALGGRLFGLVFAWLVAGCVTLAVGIFMHRNLQLPKLSVTRSTVRELMHNGAPVLAMSLATAVEPFFNANILYKMASPAVVGWYGAAWNIAGTLVAPASILGATMYPRLSTAAGDAVEFKRTFAVSFRPLLLLAILGAVGVYLFADVPIGLIYSMKTFGPAADILRAFAPVLLLMIVDMFLSTTILAAGKSGPLASCKIASVVVTTGLAFLLVPICQERFANGGLGLMYAMSIGEMLMLVAAGFLMREVIDGHIVGDICRCLLAGAATVLVIRLLPAFTPFLAIPFCILTFAGLSLLLGAVRRSDLEMLRKSTAN
jgi:O-antigen/teichoic acid export membrane protein